MGNVCVKNNTRMPRTLLEAVSQELGSFEFDEIPVTSIKKSMILKNFLLYLKERERKNDANALLFYISYLLHRRELKEIASIHIKSSFEIYDLIKNSKTHSQELVETFFDENSDYLVPLSRELSDSILEKDNSDSYHSTTKLLELAFKDNSVVILDKLFMKFMYNERSLPLL